MLQTIFIVFLKTTNFCNKVYCPLDSTTLSNFKNWSFSMKKIWCKLSNSWNFYKENPNLFSKLIQFQSKLNSFFKQKSLDFQTILKVFLNLGAILKLRWQDFRDFRPPLLTSVDIWRTLPPPSLRWQERLSKMHLYKNYFEEF